MQAPTPQEQFWLSARRAVASGTLVKLTLSKPRRKSEDRPRNYYARPVEIREELQLQVTHRYQEREEVKNHAPDEALEWLEETMGAEDYANADLFTTERQLSLSISRKGHARLQELNARHRQPAPIDHNRKKRRDISADRPYLHALGITTKEGVVKPDGKRKFKQINKFVEIIDGLLREQPLPAGAEIVDMGSGSGYLTFALYDHLSETLGLEVTVTGVELRKKLVDRGNAIAAENSFHALRFVEGYIDDFQPERIDMLIALHACDTATDDALKKGVDAGAKLLVVAPCCQKQVRRDMSPPPVLQPFLGNGILLERQAAMLTDSLRALLLEASGYKTKLFEFIPLEHTAKNVMITAVRGRPRPAAREEVARLKETFGVERHRLEELLFPGE